MAETLVDKLTRTEEGNRLYQQERTILEMTELICEVMQERGISRSELASRLSKSKGYITQLLDGEANMTLRTISDIFTALGTPIHFYVGQSPWAGITSELSYIVGLGAGITFGPSYILPSLEFHVEKHEIAEWPGTLCMEPQQVRAESTRGEPQLVY